MYAAPEILIKREFNLHKSDAWSMGIVTYVLLEGKHPWDHHHHHGDDGKMMNEHIKHALNTVKGWSEEAKDFVTKLLRTDTKCRMSIIEAFEHEWLKDFV